MKKITAVTTVLLILAMSLSTPVSSSGDTTGAIGTGASPHAPVYRVAEFSEEAEQTPGLHVVASDESGVTLELFTPEFDVANSQSTEGECQLFTVPEYGETGDPGTPRLPVLGTMIGIPPNAEITLSVLETDSTDLVGPLDLCPVPTPIIDMDISGEARYLGTDATPDPAVYSSDDFAPSSPAQIIFTGFVRSQRVAQLRLHPFQYNPASGTLRHYRYIRVRVDFSPGARRTGLTDLDEGTFEESLRTIIVNYDTARHWRSHPEHLEISAPLAELDSVAYKMMVDEAGIYQLTYAYLDAAGIPVDELDPRTFQIALQGQQIAIYVEGESDDTFDDGDYILFYGQSISTVFTDTNVYWLTWGDENGLRMPSRDSSPGGGGLHPQTFEITTHVEQNTTYNSRTPRGDDQDHWFWNLITAYGGPGSEDYTFSLEEVASGTYSATVRGALTGYTTFDSAPDHHTLVYVNDHLVDDAMWDGQSAYYFETQIPQSYLGSGAVTITVACPLDIAVPYDYVYANWFEIDYQRTYTVTNDRLHFNVDSPGLWEYDISPFTSDDIIAFDITTPTHPVRLTNADISSGTIQFEDDVETTANYIALASTEYLAPSAMVADTPSNLQVERDGADYLVITHGDFYTDVLPLVSHRSAQGLSTMVVDVQDIYDEFNGGVFNPQAIKDFLSYAYVYWTPAPTYVLLVGDGTLDFKNYLGEPTRNYIPPFLAAVDPWISETASDNLYVTISGDDPLPDMHIGRLPVNTSLQASTMITRILGYEQNPPDGAWNQQVLFVADAYDPDAGDFAALSDIIADNHVPDSYSTDKVYSGVTHSVSEARAAIISAINDGRLVVNYIGHSSFEFWGTGNLFDVSNIPSLTNTERLPLMLPMTCYEGFFHNPYTQSLGESIVRAPNGGAIASWSPTGLGVATGHDFLNRGVYDALFREGITQIGPATTYAKYYLYANSGGFYHDLLDTYILFGDPALSINVLEWGRIYLPVIFVN
jgi:hypothetical protein